MGSHPVQALRQERRLGEEGRRILGEHQSRDGERPVQSQDGQELRLEWLDHRGRCALDALADVRQVQLRACRGGSQGFQEHPWGRTTGPDVGVQRSDDRAPVYPERLVALCRWGGAQSAA